MLRQIYCLRRTFPPDLIYAPENLGGCGETRISDGAQLQKWTYLHSLSHNGGAPGAVVTSLLQRALLASITDFPVFCIISLVTWGKSMGLTLHQATPALLPSALTHFLAATQAPITRPIYTDGSFTVDSSLMAVLRQYKLCGGCNGSVPSPLFMGFLRLPCG